MAPVVVSLMFLTSSILGSASGTIRRDWPEWLLTPVSALVIWRTKLHSLWLLGAMALLGWFGWI